MQACEEYVLKRSNVKWAVGGGRWLEFKAEVPLCSLKIRLLFENREKIVTISQTFNWEYSAMGFQAS